MVSKVSSIIHLSQELPAKQPKFKELEFCRTAFVNNQQAQKKSCCNRIFKILETIQNKLKNIFYRLFPSSKKDVNSKTKESVKVEVKKNRDTSIAKNGIQPAQNLDKKEDQPRYLTNLNAVPEYKAVYEALENSEKEQAQFLADGKTENDWFIELKNKINLVPAEQINIVYSSGFPERIHDICDENNPIMTYNLLFKAIKHLNNHEQRLEIVQLLFEKGIDPHFKAEFKRTHTSIERAQEYVWVRQRILNSLLNAANRNNLELEQKKVIHQQKDALLDPVVSLDAWKKIFELCVWSNDDKYALEKLQEIKLLIPKIRFQDINKFYTIQYRTEVLNANLLYCLVCINKSISVEFDQLCFECVQLLLNQGADPTAVSTFVLYLDLLQEVEKTDDQDLFNYIQMKLETSTQTT